MNTDERMDEPGGRGFNRRPRPGERRKDTEDPGEGLDAMPCSLGVRNEMHTIPPQNCHEVAARSQSCVARAEPIAWVFG